MAAKIVFGFESIEGGVFDLCYGACFISVLLLADANWVDWLQSLITWGLLIAAIDFIVVCISVGHVVLHKRDIRAAIGWSGVIFLAPFVGSALYLMFGINRLKRRARRLLGKHPTDEELAIEATRFGSKHLLGELEEQFGPLAELGDKVIGLPLLADNHIELFASSEQSATAMLSAIERARKSVSLCTYIFDRDRVGQRFVEALKAAKDRGVEVRIIVDGVGIRYSWPSIKGWFAAAGLQVRHFLAELDSVASALQQLEMPSQDSRCRWSSRLYGWHEYSRRHVAQTEAAETTRRFALLHTRARSSSPARDLCG